jgi:hypothetical protein
MRCKFLRYRLRAFANWNERDIFVELPWYAILISWSLGPIVVVNWGFGYNLPSIHTDDLMLDFYYPILGRRMPEELCVHVREGSIDCVGITFVPRADHHPFSDWFLCSDADKASL